MKIILDELRALVSDRYMQRAKEYHISGMVELIPPFNTKVKAYVEALQKTTKEQLIDLVIHLGSQNLEEMGDLLDKLPPHTQ